MNKQKLIKNIANVLFYSVVVLTLALTVLISQAKKNGEQVSILGYKFYTVLTGSMSPTINPGSLIVVKDIDAQDIKIGDIITFGSKNTNNITTHRVKEVLHTDSIKFVTQGDANNVEDPIPVDSNFLLGKVVKFIPVIGATFSFIQSNSWILWILLGLMIAIAFIPSKSKNKDILEEQI